MTFFCTSYAHTGDRRCSEQCATCKGDTPRTDAMLQPVPGKDCVTGDPIEVVHADDCRALERELAWAKKLIQDQGDALEDATRDEKRWAALTFLHPMDVATVVCGAKDGTVMRQGLETLADRFIAKAVSRLKKCPHGFSNNGENCGPCSA